MPVQQPCEWQQTSWQQLIMQVRSNRLAHAYLITGLKGSGRYQFVTALCAYMLCEQTVSTRDTACGSCRQCLLNASDQHPDILWVSPEEGSQAIKIDQIRQLSSHVQQTSSQTGAYKIVVINPVAALAPAAANALLKSLEEPPGKALFLLISESGDHVLPTVRSRCQPLPLPPPDLQQSMNWLSQQSAADSQLLHSAAQLAPQQPFYALDLLEQGIPQWRTLLKEQLSALHRGDISVSEVARFCEKQDFRHAIHTLEDLCMQRLRELSRQHQNPAAKTNMQQLLTLHREITSVYQQFSSTANVNQLLGFEYLLGRWLGFRSAFS